MDGKVVVVTGASGALGKVVAEAALARGAKVAGVDHAASQISATANRTELGGVDLSDAAQAKKAIDAATSHFGRLDALINIAGGFAFETVTEGDPKTWQRMYALNVLTALNASRSAIPHLVASASGRIVNVGATAAQWAFVKDLVALIEQERAAYDIATHRDAPPGLRIWCGCTVERSDLAALTPWIDWAFEHAKAALPKAA